VKPLLRISEWIPDSPEPGFRIPHRAGRVQPHAPIENRQEAAHDIAMARAVACQEQRK